LDIVKLFLRHKIAVDTLNENNENASRHFHLEKLEIEAE